MSKSGVTAVAAALESPQGQVEPKVRGQRKKHSSPIPDKLEVHRPNPLKCGDSHTETDTRIKEFSPGSKAL